MDTEEEGSDVNLTSYLLLDGFDDEYQLAVVISNVSDIESLNRKALTRLGRQVGVLDPSRRRSFELHGAASWCRLLRRDPGNTSHDTQIVSAFASKLVQHGWPSARQPKLYCDLRSVASAGPMRSTLHAECVVIDGEQALVTSANFTEAVQVRNIELGLHISSPTVATRI